MESNMTHAYLFSDGKRNFAFCLFCFGFFFWRNSKSLQNQQNNNSNPQVSSACSTLKQFLLLSVADFSSEISINVRLVHILFWKVLATDSKHTQPTDVTTNATDDLCDFFAVVELREPEQGGAGGLNWNLPGIKIVPCHAMTGFCENSLYSNKNIQSLVWSRLQHVTRLPKMTFFCTSIK